MSFESGTDRYYGTGIADFQREVVPPDRSRHCKTSLTVRNVSCCGWNDEAPRDADLFVCVCVCARVRLRVRVRERARVRTCVCVCLTG